MAKKILKTNKVNPNVDWSWQPDEVEKPKTKTKYKKTTKKKKKKTRKIFSKKNDEFYRSKEWLILRVKVLEKYGCECMMCGRSRKVHKVVLHVDHIKPRSKYPELALDFNNLQILCEDCNIGKGNKYKTDWRISNDELDKEYYAIMHGSK